MKTFFIVRNAPSNSKVVYDKLEELGISSVEGYEASENGVYLYGILSDSDLIIIKSVIDARNNGRALTYKNKAYVWDQILDLSANNAQRLRFNSMLSAYPFINIYLDRYDYAGVRTMASQAQSDEIINSDDYTLLDSILPS